MAGVKIIEVNESIFAENDRAGDAIRRMMKEQGTLFLNVMSSPGSGKTTALTAIINSLKEECKIGEMDVDIETSIDAQRVADATGIDSLQIHNGGLCHVDADMVSRALIHCDFQDKDLIILENIGNLVCPAEFDTGAHKNIVLLSIPEGDDKPLKYPLMFQVADLLLISKIDTLPYFDFDMEKARDRVLALNPEAEILAFSAKTGEGMEAVLDWIRREIQAVNCAPFQGHFKK